MNTFVLTDIDLWLNRGRDRSLPADARHLITYLATELLGDWEESLYLTSNGSAHKVWLHADLYGDGWCGILLEGTCDDLQIETLLESLYAVLRKRANYCYLGNCIAPGLITEARWNWLVNSIRADLANNTRKAQEQEAATPSALVRAASALGLGPHPAGNGPNFWLARCPGTNHSIFISTESETFGCGYCNRKGGIEELKQFVEDRSC